MTESRQRQITGHRWLRTVLALSVLALLWEEASNATKSPTARRSLLQHVPELALALAGTAVVLLALAPIGWRAGWWHFRFSLLTLMSWAAYFGLAAVIVSVLALVIGLSRLDWRGIALAVVALIGGDCLCALAL